MGVIKKNYDDIVVFIDLFYCFVDFVENEFVFLE